MIKRNKLGRFIKGSHPRTEFKKGQKLTQEHKDNITKALIGNKYLLGHKQTEETKKKRIETLKKIMPKGSKSWAFKTGRTKTSQGYILIYKPKHPFPLYQKYVFEHRFIMEEILGRYLDPQERVHHINGIKDDNRKKNLMYFFNESAHRKYHRSLKLSNKNM